MNGQPLTPELLHSLERQVVGDESYTPLCTYDLIRRYGREKADLINQLRCGYAHFAVKQYYAQ